MIILGFSVYSIKPKLTSEIFILCQKFKAPALFTPYISSASILWTKLSSELMFTLSNNWAIKALRHGNYFNIYYKMRHVYLE